MIGAVCVNFSKLHNQINLRRPLLQCDQVYFWKSQTKLGPLFEKQIISIFCLLNMFVPLRWTLGQMNLALKLELVEFFSKILPGHATALRDSQQVSCR